MDDAMTPEEEDFPGRLLHQAALWDNAELLEDLLHGEQKSLIDSQDSWGRTPLHAAALTESSRCLKVLLAAGANPNISCGPRGENKTPLHVSSEHGCASNVQALLEHAAQMTAKDSNGMTALDLAEAGDHTLTLTQLKQAADEKEQRRHEQHSSLREACSHGDAEAVRKIVDSLGDEAELVINMAPSGSNTLLFTACEVGQKEIVKILLEHEADGRIHPVTKYSPLYISCYYGRKEIVELLLKKFPELVQQQTVEKWLPVHACCINGHVAVLELLLKFSYPPRVMCTLKDKSAEWEYDMPFDLNARDVTGQSVLYLACYVGNQKLVDCLLKFRVKSHRINALRTKKEDEQKVNDLISPTRKRISNGIQSIMSKLNLSKQEPVITNEMELSPLLLDLYCNNNTETALHVAVKCKHHNIISALLISGANPNLAILANEEELSRDEVLGATSGSTTLVEACRNRDLTALDLLLKYGARDDECRALEVAHKDEIMCAKLLATKAHSDPEYKINKKAMAEVSPSQFASAASLGSLTYGSLFPNTAVMINWHGQHCLSNVKPQWLIDAALTVNPRLRLNPKHQEVVLYSITRLDISRNSLTSIPIAVFQLHSLRYLNLSQNKLERLPSNEEKSSIPIKSGKHRVISEAIGYMAPVLEEIHLQYNRLEHIPEEIFQLPSLVSLDVSNNKLQSLPYLMWRAAKLKELNASFNLLRELPTTQQGITLGIDVTSLTSEQIMIRSDSFSSQCSLGRGQDDRNSSCNDISDLTDDSLQDAQTLNSTSNKNKFVQHLDLKHLNVWSRNVEVNDQILHSDGDNAENCSQLSALNLAHNAFSCIPVALPCLAVNLTRLNLSYNNLRSMGYVTSYPSTMKQLDLSHNQICCWPSLPQIDAFDGSDLSHLNCYCPSEATKPKKLPILSAAISGRLSSSKSLRTMILSSVCTHRRHLKLDAMRTLILADNGLERIQLSTDDDGGSIAEEDESEESDPTNPNILTGKSKMMFPNLSMLDISNNRLHEIPKNINDLSNLSVLNISGNPDISELPSQMGLLSRLWNLNTNGCGLQEPLKSMIESKKYKTMDVIGYLKSVLEDARPYARIKLMIVGVQGIGKTSLLEQLRMEGSGSYKKKPSEHWAKRMGNKNINVKTSRGTNMSTVGVDIGDWAYEKRGRAQNSYGPVVFRTWDFGGQREYYATHQYFLSKRSLYLVVWKIPDGTRGIAEILQWLVNIQARAPNSPVLIVGTHYDMAKDLPSTEDLQQYIREKFINIVDAEKCGLPRVLDTIEISCKTRHNVKHLCNLIYDTVYSLRSPGSKELLLEQRVPASYLALEDVVSIISAERRHLGADPVLLADEYRAKVAYEMQSRYHRTFRDAAELNQATAFLHENGVLLHYDDATLKDLYFLDPQWLCDMLAHVVTIREINPFARTGVMKLDDLKHVFKSSSIGPVDKRGYIVNLLNKFEVALTWDSRTLLIPSLLLSEEQMRGPHPPEVRVKIPVRSRGWAVRTKKAPISHATTIVGNSSFYTPSSETFKLQKPNSSQISGPKRDDVLSPEQPAGSLRCDVSTKSDPESSIRRLLLMSYFPSGFWSRLMTRILADDAIVDIVRSYFVTPKEVINDASLAPILEHRADWVLWQTGMELRYFDTTLFRMKEVLPNIPNSPVDYRQMRFKLKQEETWTDVDLSSSSILELYFPVETLILNRQISEDAGWGGDTSYQTIVLDPSMECVTKLLALAVDHIDILLEDWYPTLGTRFVHTSEGRFLVTRLVPCPRCVATYQENEHAGPMQPDAWGAMGRDQMFNGKKPFLEEQQEDRVRKSQESYTSCDSGVEPDSVGSSRTTSFEGHPAFAGLERLSSKSDDPLYYSWLVEECILAAYDKKAVQCPAHGEIGLPSIAPDTMFLDLGERHLIRPDNIKRGKLLGRGAFGFVFRGNCKMRGSSQYADIAMKMLQPVQPGSNARPSALIAFKAAQGKWERDPLQYACKAYCTARQELNILLSLRHPYIVPLVGICTRPLALVLDLAPQGALDTTLKHYRRSGAKLGPYSLQTIILQVAKAIEYLHQQHIIYRDLKSENVLVWEMPPPFCQDPLARVQVKLADYGISRLTLPSGTKGFGGTEGFMAPEIMRYNGEEEYTEKVDCFSFGMFIYELLTLHQPFEGQESVKECILEGGRPSLSYRETLYPSYILDLMVLCWSQQPRDRPTASHIVSIASAPEFTHLSDVITLNHTSQVSATTAVSVSDSGDETSAELWLGCINSRADLLLASNSRGWCNYCNVTLPGNPTAACQVGSSVWVGDHKGYIHGYLASDCTQLFSYNMEPDAPNPCPIVSLLWMPELQRVAVAMANGRLFMVRSDVLPSAPSMGEGSFVMTELGNSTVLHAITVIYKNSGRTCELWCGESRGSISIFTIKDNIVSSQEVVNHYEPMIENLEVLHLISSHSPAYAGQEPSIWSYVYPGCVVYHWEPSSRTILHKLDCSKLVPCSESLKSISIEEHLSPGRCQVTCISVVNDELYVGTTWGCIIVVEKNTMRPITIFRPYEEDVRAIVALAWPAEGREVEGAAPAATPMVATIGRGYRDLLSRFVDSAALAQESSNSTAMIALLWRAHNWATT